MYVISRKSDFQLYSILMLLGRLLIEFPYAGPIWVFLLGDAVEIVVILFFPMFVFG